MINIKTCNFYSIAIVVLLPCVVALRVLLDLFSAFEGEHLSRLINEKGRVEASEIGVVDLGLSETEVG